ncbi:glutamine synthetase [Thermosporothrix hazakensis]|jgi:glutamine synthetase|uniref:Glutamine synthetase n=1 Tax=Thermosporothrix hazakensis TaxID=644383 RepID=A0A326UDC2_THEHA|nr:glutamine synthetase family protein [Thermosporothrix hazakensis]PZW36034.1 glutamine synthetase [Thermosporothrix hazakensis]GCE46686.1 glutamine synthetase [Thermosporothrix hazakensis]
MDVQDVLRLTRTEHIRLVRFLYCDNGGIIRGKATHTSKLLERMVAGIGQSLAMQAFSGMEQLVPVEGMGPIGEFRLIPDPETFTLLPYVPATASMFCDMVRLDGVPWEACPRTFLKRMIARLAEHGIRAEAGVEHEFYLARRDIGQFTPADQSLCYSSAGLDEQADYINALLEALEQQGISIELYHTELGPAQQELSVSNAPVLQAADTICLVRETVRGVARTFNLYASFAPKPFLDQAGSGAHIHFSLWDKGQPHKNLFFDPEERGGFSQVGRYFVGGLLAHMRGLMALTCACPNSYQRVQPRSWSGAYNVYGYDNREAAVRIPSLFKGREVLSANIELKCSDHSGNPYLALGGMIAAGLDGIQKRLDPGAPLEMDPANYSNEERELLGIRRLPTSLDEALNALEQDAVLREALGPLLLKSYLAVKWSEQAYFQDKTPEEEALSHFSKY